MPSFEHAVLEVLVKAFLESPAPGKDCVFQREVLSLKWGGGVRWEDVSWEVEGEWGAVPAIRFCTPPLS